MLHTISCLVQNRAGVLARVVSGISENGINIHSAAVSETEDVDTTRMTFVVEGGDQPLDDITKHVAGLKDVVEVEELPEGHYLSRQMMLIKVRVAGDTLARVMQVAEMFHATVLDLGRDTMTLELTGEEDQITAMVKVLRSEGIVELARSGRIAVKHEVEG